MRSPAPPQRPSPYPFATPIPHPDALAIPDGATCCLHASVPTRAWPWRVVPCAVRTEIQSTTPMPLSAAVGGLVIRPVIAGCLITPSELSLDPSRQGHDGGSFSVTPLAEGVLRGRVDVLRNGQVCYQLPLAVRCGTLRPAGWLAAAAVAVPWLWYELVGAAATAGAVEAAVNRHLPPWFARVGAVVEQLLAAGRVWENALHVGFWAAVGLAAAAVSLAVKRRPRRVTTITAPFVLDLGPSPSTRSRPLPPYLIPVPPDELNRLGR